MRNLITISAPKITDIKSARSVMIDVLIALIPTLISGTLIFGWRSLITIAISAGSAVIFEYLYCLLTKKDQSVTDLSAMVTGVIIGLILPPAAPLWLGAVGSAIAIIIFKQLFGGLGKNFANPAIAARIVLAIAFPAFMSMWADPCAWMNTSPDIITSATPLSNGAGTISYWNMFLGVRGGCIGETCIMLILCGGLYLIARKVISPIIPIGFIGSVALSAFIAGKDPLFWIMSGGVVFASVFMATDYATSPKTPLGRLIFGIGCGAFTALIRLFTGLTEGVAIAILLMNILAPYIDKLIMMIPIKSDTTDDSIEEEIELAEEDEEEEFDNEDFVEEAIHEEDDDFDAETDEEETDADAEIELEENEEE